MRRRAWIYGLLLWTSPVVTAIPALGQPPPVRAAQTYACPMHPAVTTTQPGRCAQCGMTLEPIDAGRRGRGYRLAYETGSEPVMPGRPFALKLTVRPIDGDAIVRDFTVVHEKRFHLFVISRDLQYYQHLHPTQDRTGAWIERLSLPTAGEYRIFADLLPTGATAQLLTATIQVGSPSPALSAVTLQPDAVLEQTVGDVRAHLTLPPGGLLAGRHQPLRFRFVDAKSGEAIRDLQPYLGAWGHTVMVSEDLEHFVHAHPSEPLSGKAGGPQLTFRADPPAPGRYRVWTQIMRRGSLETVVFTLAVDDSR